MTGHATARVGASATVVDALERVTGRIGFVQNERREGMLHARILRGVQAHASIVSVDATAAMALPGVAAVVTGADVPADADGPRLFGNQTRDTPPLAVDRVRYVGEPVAAVAAVDLDTAEAALSRIRVELRPLPASLTMDDAAARDAQPIHGTGNLVDTRQDRAGDVDEALARADAIVTETFVCPPLQGVPLETHVALAEWDEAGLTVHTATQTPHHVRRELAHLFGLAPERVRVVVATLGGGFGAKAYTRIEPIAALLAHRAGRPVKLVLTRSEEFVTVHRQAARMAFTTGVARDGRLLALRATCDFGSGAYAGNTPRVLRHGLYSLVGPYRVGAHDLTARGWFTNTPPCGPMRAPGTAQVQWAREAHLDAVAAAIGMDPLEFRRRNLLGERDRFLLGGPIGPMHLPALLDTVAMEPGRPARAGRRRGAGVGVAMKTTATPTTSAASMTVDRTGRIRVLTSSVEMGQGARTALAQLSAAAMSVDLDSIDISLPDTGTTPPDDGTVSSRSTFSMGSAVQRAAGQLRERLAAIAADHLEIARTDLVAEDGRIRPVDNSSPGLTYGDLVALSGLDTLDADGSFTNEPMRDPATGEEGVSTHHHQAAAGALVEVDVETGAVELLEVRVATHAGLVVNPVLAEHQSEGNATFGIGQALMEELVLDEGQVQNGSLADYPIPSFRDMPPRVWVALHEDDHREVHGIGETALPAVVPAITNAIAAAIGARLHLIPATPERVLRALRGEPPPA
jgi:CO/xanthine dehydrogenase Mo-binding subunit